MRAKSGGRACVCEGRQPRRGYQEFVPYLAEQGWIQMVSLSVCCLLRASQLLPEQGGLLACERWAGVS